eukprot:Colp12_sorted_trinity150504_noHs@34644
MDQGGTSALLLGPSGAGKTLLVRQLRSLCAAKKANEPFSPNTVPTVGADLHEINDGKRTFSIRELGGAMAPVWEKYFKDCSTIIYLLDMANMVKLSEGIVNLMEVLAHEETASLPVLLFLNKTDVPGHLTRSHLNTVLRLDDLLLQATQKITIIAGSAMDQSGVYDIVTWLRGKQKSGSRNLLNW